MRLLNTLKQYWFVITTILLISCLIPLYSENLYKVLIITFIIILWCVLGIILKKFTLSSLLILLLILPFNITYQLPYSVGNLIIANPYADGLFVNYLVPTVSILDIGVFLLLISICFENILSIKWRGFAFIKVFILFVLFLLIQNILVGNFLSIFISIRWLVYIFTFYQLSKNYKELVMGKERKNKVLMYILILSLMLVVIQGCIALIQFRSGSSLGLSILGESQVVSGMVGSSFISLNNQLYLRGYGTFPHPNVFGGWLMFNIFLGWYLYLNLEKRRYFAIVLMILSTLVISLTFSRLGYLVTVGIWSVFLSTNLMKISSRKKGGKSKEFGMVGLISERVLNLFGNGDNSWSERVDLIRSSIEVIKNNLISGTGLGRFINNMGSVVRSDSGIFILQPVHNIFLLLLSELGIIGLGLFSTLIYFFIKPKNFNVRFITVLICLLIWGMFDHYWISLPQGQVFLFLLLVI